MYGKFKQKPCTGFFLIEICNTKIDISLNYDNSFNFYSLNK